MGVFADQLSAFAAKTKLKTNLTAKEVVLGISARLVELSPVGDPALWVHPAPKSYVPGTFKANWVGSVDSIDYTTTDETDPSGELSMVNINSAIPEDIVGHQFYITNSLPYAIPLENGHSSQAPAGMVCITSLEFQSIVSEAVAKVRVL